MIDFKSNYLEWIICSFEIPLEKSNWKSLLKYFGKRDKTLMAKDDKLVLGQELIEKQRNDYHIHFDVEKYLVKKKERYLFSISFHVDPPGKVKSPKKYPLFRVNNFHQWFLQYLPETKKIKKIKTDFTVVYEFDSKNVNVISGIPFDKTIEMKEISDILGETSFSGFSLDFNDSKMGLERLTLGKSRNIIYCAQSYSVDTNLLRDFIQDIFEISQRVNRIFIKSKTLK